MIKEVFYTRLDRRNFGDLLNSDRARMLGWRTGYLGEVGRYRPHGSDVVAVSSVDPREDGIELPDLLICEDGSETDWSAWITTYGARIRPFTAYTRLLTSKEFDWWTSAHRDQPSLRSTAWSAAGLVLGEIMAAGKLTDRALQTLPAVSLSSTLSFAMLRASALYDTYDNWEDLLKYWEFVRTATGQRARVLNGTAIWRVVRCFINAADLHHPKNVDDSDHDLSNACQQVLRTHGEAPVQFLDEPLFYQTFERMRGPREERVSAFSDFLRNLDRLRSDPELIAFMLGFLTSRIAPGTLQHMSVLAPVLDRHPTAPLWYGISAGVGRGQTEKSSRNESAEFPPVARRVVRDLLKEDSLLGSPACDISILEMIALSRGGNPLQSVITATQGTATIELIPGVTTTVSVSRGTQPDASLSRPLQVAAITELEEAIERLRRVHRQLQTNPSPHENEDGQHEMFPTKRRSKK